MSKPFIITQLLGGVGNQMFQYAVGRRLAHDHGLKLLVDDSILMDHAPGRHAVNRHYDLDMFTLEVERATPAQRRWFNPHGLSVADKILFRAHRAVFGSAKYQERFFGYDAELVRRTPPPPYLEGLWQSCRYLEGIEDLLREDFRFREPLLETSSELARALQQPEAVCLNVRRGDSLSVAAAAATMGFAGTEYYRRAAAWMAEEMGTRPRYFVFTDDLEWCEAELRWLGPDTVFVGDEHAGWKYSNKLQLMSLAHHFVIANSTYGWWAAWLSAHPSKRVVAPRYWFRDTSKDTPDLCPPDWVRL